MIAWGTGLRDTMYDILAETSEKLVFAETLLGTKSLLLLTFECTY